MSAEFAFLAFLYVAGVVAYLVLLLGVGGYQAMRAKGRSSYGSALLLVGCSLVWPWWVFECSVRR